jgi:hypothetical protein
MDHDSTKPLSVEEAKARLRVAANRASPSAWMRQHPLPAVGIALLAGLATGRLHSQSVGGLLLALKLIPPLLLGKSRWKASD